MYPLFLLSIVNIFIWIYMHGHQAQWNIYETMGICSHLHTSGRPYSNREVRLCPTHRPVPSWFKNDPPGLDFSAHWLKEASLKLLAGSKWSVALHDTWNKMQTPTLHCVHSTQQCTTGLYYILMYQAKRIQRRSQQLSPIAEHNGTEPQFIYHLHIWIKFKYRKVASSRLVYLFNFELFGPKVTVA